MRTLYIRRGLVSALPTGCAVLHVIPLYENLSWKECASANFEQRITWSRLIEGVHRRAVEERVADVEDVRQAPLRIGAMTQETAALNRQLKAFLTTKVYESDHLIEHRVQAVAKIEWLFNFLLTDPERISAGFRENLET